MTFQIGRLFHVIHISDDLPTLDAWYDDVYAPRWGIMDNTYSEHEMRYASLPVVADTIVETMAPARVPGAESLPVARFEAKFGRRWHSLAWYVDDVGEIYDHLQQRGVRLTGHHGSAVGSRPQRGPIYTHPRDTHTQLEFYSPVPDIDFRFHDDFDATAWERHPIGIKRLAYATIVVGDVARATDFFTEGLHGHVICERQSTLTMTRNVYVLIGSDTVVELAQPLDGESLAGRDLATNGDMCHAIAWHVNDLDATAEYLASRHIRVIDRDDATLVADPADSFGAVTRFTTDDIPGDPRG